MKNDSKKAIEKRKRNTNASTMIIVVINYVGDELRRVTKDSRRTFWRTVQG